MTGLANKLWTAGWCEQPAEGRASLDPRGLGEREWLLSVPWGVERADLELKFGISASAAAAELCAKLVPRLHTEVSSSVQVSGKAKDVQCWDHGLMVG